MDILPFLALCAAVALVLLFVGAVVAGIVAGLVQRHREKRSS